MRTCARRAGRRDLDCEARLRSGTIEAKAINTLRTLAMDAVQAASSGHPGTPMALAPVVYTLWQRHLRFDPEDCIWPNRDRFVLSVGHASMLLYAMLHLTGVKAVNAHEKLTAEGVRCRVVSMPSWELFDRQDEAYRESVLPRAVTARVSVEQASTLGWHRYVGTHGVCIGMRTFGASAPLAALQEKFGFTPEAVLHAARAQLSAAQRRDGRTRIER